uniref:Dihydrolipoamide acetyltransferase component of pyruvate dehydrogenase complex n=1 Tax=Panagrolaimus superbus TaxID=310955 RepID=A0A914XZ02_9BILA
MPLKNLSYHRAKITPSIAAAIVLHAAAAPSPTSSRDFHSSSSLITSFLGEGKPQHILSSHVLKFKKIQSYRSSSSGGSGNDTSLPSHIKVNLPALSPTMESGTIVSWQKKEGDKLEEGDLLCEIETDKATMGFETPEEGYLAKILIPEGAKDISIGKLLCIIVLNKEDIAKFENYENEIPSEPAAPAVAGKTVVAPPKESLNSVAPQPAEPGDIAVTATPFAKELADKQGVDLHDVIGSGPDGKVLAADIISGGLKSQSPAGSNVEGFVDLPISPLRQTLAKKLVDTKFNIPHYYLTSEILLENVLLVREKLNNLLEKTTGKKSSKPQKLTVEDFVIKAAALACLKVPETNSFYMGTHVRQNQSVNMSVAVNTGHGFVTPVIQNAQSKGLIEINKEILDFSKRAISGEILPHEFENGTFTISSTTFFGDGEANFSAILNPPQACNLAIGKSTKKLIPRTSEEYNEEGITSVSNLTVTLSCDHRVVDGANGAIWLKYFKEYLENPQLMLI